MRKPVFDRSTAILLATLGSLLIFQAAQADEIPPKQLVEYVQNAKKHGATDLKIRQQARDLGWAAAMVEKAIAQEGGKVSPPSRPAIIASARPESADSPAPSEAAAPRSAEVDRAASNRALAYEYLIGAGDTLQVSVWNEPNVSVQSAVVRPDGKITMPLIKEVEVAGLTPPQAEKIITASLSRYITDANVTVVVSAINSKKVYVIGAVRKEGTLPYTYGMSVLQALSEAGGLTEYAKRKKIYVLRAENGRDYRLGFNYDEAVRGERMEQNIVLLPGDTVVIPH